MATQHLIPFGVQRRRPGLAGWLARLASLRARLQRAPRSAAVRRLEHLDLDQRVREVGEW